MSAPAPMARSTTSSSVYSAAMASICRSSVTTTPSYPRRPRSSPLMTEGDSVAGKAGSSPAWKRCPVMTIRCPGRPSAERYGDSSRSLHVALMSVTPLCESACALPCPGKCLKTAMMPASFRPSAKAAPCAATACGSAEKLRPRRPMAGEAGYTFTSSTGAKLRLTPSSRNMRPMPRAVRRVASGVPRPSSAAEGYAGKPSPGWKRATLPPS